MNKPAYFSLGFLFLFLSSFSTSTFISYNSSLKQIIHINKAKELNPDAAAISSSEDLVFEETENDGEDAIDPIQTLIPSFLNFHLFVEKINIHFREFIELSKKLNSLFLSIRVIRI